MPPLDVTSPEGLERAEQVTAAAARAISRQPDLRFRGHVMHVGLDVAPVRAPYLHPDVEDRDLDDLRGIADGVALRLALSDEATYARHCPDGDVETLVYEVLEQLRVESLAPEAMPGVRTNLRHLFEAWTARFIEEGMLEDDLGILLFSVIHVCRSRILAEPIEERVSDHTEATRFGIYEVIGEHVRDLRSLRGDQEEFARRAAALASAIADLAAGRRGAGSPAAKRASVLSMLEVRGISRDEDVETDGADAREVATTPVYRAFTTAYDETAHVDTWVRPHAQASARAELDALLSEHRPLAGCLSRGAQAIFPAPRDDAWQSEEEEGYVDPRLLTSLVTGSREGRIFRLPSPVARPRGAVSIVVDCSGSMKGPIPQVAVLVDALVRALDGVDVLTEVLGYTTGAWSGGRPHREWLAAGRPANPGRLNEARHIIFKDAATSWRQTRRGIAALLWTPQFREGIDGEAVEWAYGRLRGVEAPHRHLIVISDGSPMDGATTLTNEEGYLDRHLQEVVEEIECASAVRVSGLGIGHDMSAYVRESRFVEPDRILELSTARTLLSFLARP